MPPARQPLKSFFIKNSKINLEKYSFSLVVAEKNKKKLPENNFKKEMKRLLFHILKTEDSYIEIDKIISDFKNHYRRPNYL